MRDKRGIWRLFGQCLASCTCSLLAACGSSDDGGSGAAVLRQAPHCPAGSDALKIEGSIAGGSIDDFRTAPNINAGFENFMGGKFSTPLGDFAPLPDNQLALTFDWAGSLFNGQSGAITAGNMTLPATHPRAGAQFCVSAGQVGFVDGGSEDNALKFAITEVKAESDCSGAAKAVDLRGCLQ